MKRTEAPLCAFCNAACLVIAFPFIFSVLLRSLRNITDSTAIPDITLSTAGVAPDHKTRGCVRALRTTFPNDKPFCNEKYEKCSGYVTSSEQADAETEIPIRFGAHSGDVSPLEAS